MQTVIVYGKPDCEYCKKAEDLLIKHDVNYVMVYDIDELKERIPEATTVPHIFVYDCYPDDEEYLGGYEDLLDWLADEKD